MSKEILKLIQLKLKSWKKKIQCPKHLATRSSSSSTLPTSGWTNHPKDILDKIMKKMCFVYLLTFGVVCKPWRLMYINYISRLPRNIPIGVPILLLNTGKRGSNSRKFVNMSGELASDEIFMPEASNKWICGSSCGWLILEGIDHRREVSLLNPLTRRAIQLPSINTSTIRLNWQGKLDAPLDGFSYMRKAILSTNPTTSTSEQDCVIMSIVGKMRRLSYCRIGDRKWTNVESSLAGLCDIICYEGKFYATDDFGALMSCDIIDSSTSTEIIAMGYPYKHEYRCSGMNHLVMTSERRLLLVSWIMEKYCFEFYLLEKCNPYYDKGLSYTHLRISNPVETRHRWVEIEIDSIGDQLLFVGNNSSFFLPAQWHSGRANCIYFTDHRYLRLNDNYIGMYDIARKSILLYNGKIQDELLSSFWVTPTP